MSLRQTISRPWACASCATTLARAFVAAAAPAGPAASNVHGYATPLVRRAPFSSQARQLADERHSPLDQHLGSVEHTQAQSQARAAEEDNAEVEETAQADSAAAHQETPAPPVSSSDEGAVPWYLQVNPPPAQDQAQHPLSERQRLPELPQSPPEILQPILEHVSVDLGIDDLTLLDLRTIDPPPALGANLLMVVGTARSEKHLHVSADRLCRWLRSNHGLSPFADGLLGRNELKLKMRRKAKRTRLLSAVGAKETGRGDIDDGIRTGWVCVNVGKVPGGVLKEQEETEVKDFVGFGSQTQGSTIVVQMMTAEKRGDIDLETLWSGILRRANKRREEHRQEAEAENVIDGPSVSGSPSISTNHVSVSGPLTHQVRAFSTSVQWRLPTLSAVDDKGAHPPPSTSTNRDISDPASPDSDKQATLTLCSLLDDLKTMAPDAALEALGKGRGDTMTTPFLRSFYAALPRFPDETHWQCYIELLCHAVKLGHPCYKASFVIKQLDQMRLACVMPTEPTYTTALETILSQRFTTTHVPRLRALRNTAVRNALDILDRMHEDGYNPVSESILRLLYKHTALPPLPSYVPFDSLATSQQNDTSASSSAASAAPKDIASLLPTLSTRQLLWEATTASLQSVKTLWHLYPQRFESRSSDQYVALFSAAAATNSQRDASDVLRFALPDMAREQPVVELEGNVARAVKRCLEVAEPGARELGESGERGEWAVLWRRCVRALGG